MVEQPTQIMRIVAWQPGRLHPVHEIACGRRANASSRSLAVWWDSGAGLVAKAPLEACVRFGLRYGTGTRRVSSVNQFWTSRSSVGSGASRAGLTTKNRPSLLKSQDTARESTNGV